MSKTYTQDEVDLLLARRDAELYKCFMEDLKKIIEKISDTKTYSSTSSGYWKGITSTGGLPPNVMYDTQTFNKNIS